MFTGIIKEQGRVKNFQKRKGSALLTIFKPKFKINLGDSIATNGVCLTVKSVDNDSYTTELMTETLNKSTFGKKVDKLVNLEPALKVNDRMYGHFVTGHVDAVGKIINIKKAGNSEVYTLNFPKKFNNLVVAKGSIAIDGISLTVVDVEDNNFTVSLVKYTLENTNLSLKKKNSLVNLEFDILAKYVNRKS